MQTRLTKIEVTNKAKKQEHPLWCSITFSLQHSIEIIVTPQSEEFVGLNSVFTECLRNKPIKSTKSFLESLIKHWENKPIRFISKEYPREPHLPILMDHIGRPCKFIRLSDAIEILKLCKKGKHSANAYKLIEIFEQMKKQDPLYYLNPDRNQANPAKLDVQMESKNDHPKSPGNSTANVNLILGKRSRDEKTERQDNPKKTRVGIQQTPSLENSSSSANASSSASQVSRGNAVGFSGTVNSAGALSVFQSMAVKGRAGYVDSFSQHAVEVFCGRKK